MVSYRLLMFGLGLGAVGITLIFMSNFVSDILSISASFTSTSQAQSGRDIMQLIFDGLGWVTLVLAAIFVIAGALEDRARRFA